VAVLVQSQRADDNHAGSQDPNTGVLLLTGVPAPIYRPDAGRSARVGVQWTFATR
jgi:hypothetical protein